MESRIVMHPVKLQLEGKDLSELKDVNGKLVFPSFVDTVKQQGAGDSLDKIAASVSTIFSMNTQIATAAEQQSEEGTSQLVAASETLTRLGEQLNSLIHQFKTG